MSLPDAPTLQQKPLAKSMRQARERVLPVAQIFSVLQGEAQGGHAMVTLVIGDERTDPRKHGIRASHADWVQLVGELADASPELRERLIARLRA